MAPDGQQAIHFNETNPSLIKINAYFSVPSSWAAKFLFMPDSSGAGRPPASHFLYEDVPARSLPKQKLPPLSTEIYQLHWVGDVFHFVVCPIRSHNMHRMSRHGRAPDNPHPRTRSSLMFSNNYWENLKGASRLAEKRAIFCGESGGTCRKMF